MNEKPTTKFRTELHSEKNYKGIPITVWKIVADKRIWYCAKSTKPGQAEIWTDRPDLAIHYEQTNLDNQKTSRHGKDQPNY